MKRKKGKKIAETRVERREYIYLRKKKCTSHAYSKRIQTSRRKYSLELKTRSLLRVRTSSNELGFLRMSLPVSRLIVWSMVLLVNWCIHITRTSTVPYLTSASEHNQEIPSSFYGVYYSCKRQYWMRFHTINIYERKWKIYFVIYWNMGCRECVYGSD